MTSLFKSREKKSNPVPTNEIDRPKLKRRSLLVKIAVVLAAIAVLGAAGLFGGYWYFIARDPGDEMSLANVERVFKLESPVYYDDEQTVIGVFFQEEHRSYVPYELLPRNFIHAIISAEDRNFFSHPGFDIKGIARAFIRNVKAGRVVQGGSTITQQTAENLFIHKNISLKAKFVELIHALQLEAHYSKEQILEWYCNQFYVSGNGRGIGVAAQYFFNKPVEDLTLLECAFLAGSVKGPNRYNPFVKRTDEDKRKAIQRAKERTNYVLGQMLANGFISENEYNDTVNSDIPFQRGNFRYPLNTLMDEVRELLEKSNIQLALFDAGIENIATSGIRIYTSINPDLQRISREALINMLSTLETKLTGYDRSTVQARYNKVKDSAGVNRSRFLFGKVKSIQQEPDDYLIEVELPGKEVGWIDREGFTAFALAFAQSMRGPWAKSEPEDEQLILEQIEVGDDIFVRVREKDPSGRCLLSMEQYPDINGGVLVLQDGFIKAMVGGADNVHFNRALDAKRQAGSVFKPLVYLAALQLDWSNLDPLYNRWQGFQYQGQLYVPKPDEESPHDWVSMTWAGTKSENIATIWLLYHLCDKLTFSQMKELAEVVDMAPRPGESRRHFTYRIRDDMGILIDQDALVQTAFEEVRDEIRTDLIFEGHSDALQALDDLHYGIGVEKYLEERKWTPDLLDESELKENEKKELETVNHNFLRLKALQEEMKNDYEVLKWAVGRTGLAESMPQSLYGRNRFFWQSQYQGAKLVYTQEPKGRALVPVSIRRLAEQVALGKTLEEIIPISDIWIDGSLPSELLDKIEAGIGEHVRELRSLPPYDMSLLCRVRDYKVALALKYVVHLAETVGIDTHMEAVLSLPLGANSVTLKDVAQMYYCFITGKVFIEDELENRTGSSMITRIEDQNGEVIYKAQPRPRNVLGPPQCHLVADILRKVISYGTGRQANQSVLLSGTRHQAVLDELKIRMPILGKTGTSDEYRNSSFVGFIPGESNNKSALSLEHGVAIAAYVGYDDNRPMKNDRIRIYGSAGALPVWLDVAGGAGKYLGFENGLDIVDLTFRPESTLAIQWPKELIEVHVDPAGLPNPDSTRGPLVRTYGKLNGKEIQLRRFFSPVGDKG